MPAHSLSFKFDLMAMIKAYIYFDSGTECISDFYPLSGLLSARCRLIVGFSLSFMVNV